MKTLSAKRILTGSALLLLLLSGCGGGGAGSGSSFSGSGSPAGTLSATLNWSSPATRVDGSTLTSSEIAGYKLHYGTSSGDYNTVIDVGNSTSYTVDSLSGGTYYFAVTAYDINGNESPYSAELTSMI